MKLFLEKYPLYEEYVLYNSYNIQKSEEFFTPHRFNNQTFQYYCEHEEDIRTHKLVLSEMLIDYYGLSVNYDMQKKFMKDGRLDYTFESHCQCLSCGNQLISFYFHVYSSKIIPEKRYGSLPPKNNRLDVLENNLDENSGVRFENKDNPDVCDIIIKKVGSNPKIKPRVDNSVLKYLDRESRNWYFKGCECIDNNIGVGSLAYFRKIIEKDLIKLVEDIKILPDANSNEIDKLLVAYYKDHKISSIYENIFEHLPHSLKSLGDNPIKLLYKQTSKGLHNLSEKDSLNKSKNILSLLNFVIKKINEEKSVISDLREKIKLLKQ